MENSLRDYVMGTLSHLDVRRAQLTSDLHKVEQLIKGLRSELDGIGKTAELPFTEHSGAFVGLSVRWSVFMFLCEHSGGTGTLNMIADALKAGGLSSRGLSFNSNVSAVLSQMTAKGELIKNADRFTLTEHGKHVWAGIQKSTKFVNRNNGTGSVEAK